MKSFMIILFALVAFTYANPLTPDPIQNLRDVLKDRLHSGYQLDTLGRRDIESDDLRAISDFTDITSNLVNGVKQTVLTSVLKILNDIASNGLGKRDLEDQRDTLTDLGNNIKASFLTTALKFLNDIATNGLGKRDLAALHHLASTIQPQANAAVQSIVKEVSKIINELSKIAPFNRRSALGEASKAAINTAIKKLAALLQQPIISALTDMDL
ncbi:hypothetical protein SNEBB_000948 [Seison nebaliae]|nr:hypothetical protein SNEBB_000948 [Seison nebaliae]